MPHDVVTLLVVRFVVLEAVDYFSFSVEVSASLIFDRLEVNWSMSVVLLTFEFHDLDYLPLFPNMIELLFHHKSILQYYSNEFPIVPDTGSNFGISRFTGAQFLVQQSERFHYHALQIHDECTYGPESYFESGPRGRTQIIWKWIKNAI